MSFNRISSLVTQQQKQLNGNMQDDNSTEREEEKNFHPFSDWKFKYNNNIQSIQITSQFFVCCLWIVDDLLLSFRHLFAFSDSASTTITSSTATAVVGIERKNCARCRL